MNDKKLTPERQALVDTVIKHLEEGTGLWKQGWRGSGRPESGITHKQYRGVNNLMLTLVAMERGYQDNRWITYNQMESNGWSFKTDEEGKSLGKGKGVAIEFYELRDRETKRAYDKSVLDGMDEEERREYIDKNVYPIRKYFRVFNAELIDGMPEKEVSESSEFEVNEKAERLLDYWSENQCPIVYGGSMAFYSPSKDEIHLPNKKEFYSEQEFYSAALHETGHSTGHSSRLNRDLSGKFGSKEYAVEELRAEIASLFMEQDLGIVTEKSEISNNSAYINNWLQIIKDDPDVLFKAIADADRIAQYVDGVSKQADEELNTECYAIVEREGNNGDPVYEVHVAKGYGGTRKAIPYSFESKEALMKEFDDYMQAPAWKEKHFKEVSMDELSALSIKAYEKEQRQENVTEEQSSVFIPPSVIAAKSQAEVKEERTPVDMKGRGIDSLTRMSDREIVEKAYHTKSKEKFSLLYNGGSLFNDEEKDERSLMARIAMFTNGDQEQLLRVFRSSGQFRDSKPNAFYEAMARDAMTLIGGRTGTQNYPFKPHTSKSRFGANAKT